MTASTLDVELAAAANRRRWNRTTIVLAVALLLAGGLVAGIEVQKEFGTQPSAAGPGGFRGQGGFTPPTALPGGGSVAGGTQGRPQRANTTTGTVKLIDGSTVYLQTESGEVITIRTNGDTSVRVPGQLKSFKTGDKVSVDGATDANGSVTASSVTKTN
ncbi:hypothetical protein F8271_23410 [Micromonospora sp. ALFpr18c]|uniref:hypothetical protein n=1 Tax=unclassified Micromonospora TaxID=2617518 RepID=UPI00124BAE0E|nr:hypothetical protein [Micromonospora sp. ALFpr18c]KAB1934437.1 hypothetical protein F8271_23410 [Micromonospora sp. ALFpr18c]